MTIIARAGRAVRANSASRSPPAGSGARFSRRQSLAIPAAGRPRHYQARDHGQPMKPGASIGETRQPLPGAPDDDHRQSRPGRSGNPGRPDRPWSAAAPDSAAGTRSRFRKPAGQGTANHVTTGNPMKPGAPIVETRQPFPVALAVAHHVGTTRRQSHSQPRARQPVQAKSAPRSSKLDSGSRGLRRRPSPEAAGLIGKGRRLNRP